jgi:hypothetical protein
MLSQTLTARAADLAGALDRLRDRLERSPQLPDLLLAETLVLLDRSTERVEKALTALNAAANELPFRKVALEIEGGVWTNGRHVRGKGFLGDIEKYNAAAVRGWRLLRCTPEQFESGEIFPTLRAALRIRRDDLPNDKSLTKPDIF